MPKRPSPLEEPPSASSSSEESEDMEVEGGEEEEEVEESQEEQITSVKSSNKRSSSSTASNATAISTPQPRSLSDEVSDSDTDSGSDSESSRKTPKPSAQNVKPISSKPMNDNAKSKKPSSVTTAAMATAVNPTKVSKRSLEMVNSEKDSKQKAKKKKESGDAGEENGRGEETEEKQGGGEDSKKQFQRLWSEEDKIVILKGLLNYKKKGLNPTSNLNAFLDSIKGSLHIDVNRSQLHSKLRRLKHWYFSQASRGKNGEDPHFTKPHEAKVYQLSKKIWGDKEGKGDKPEANNVEGDSVKVDAKKSKGVKIGNGVVPTFRPKAPVALESHLEASENRDEEQLLSLGQSGKSLTMPPSVLADYIAKEGLAILGSEETKKFEQKWRKLLLAETRIYIQRLELAQEYAMAIVDKLEAADSSV